MIAHDPKARIQHLETELARLRKVVDDVKKIADVVDGGNLDEEYLATHLREGIEELQELVFNDELTRVLNRRGFYERFTLLFNEALTVKQGFAPRYGFSIAGFGAIFIDLDDFKQVNDTYGHEVGDDVLKRTAEVLSDNVRGIDGVARFGGEEFVIALIGVTEEQVYEKGELIRKLIKNKVSVPTDAKRIITASIGVASLDASDTDDLDELVGYADKAMYEAKIKKGKNAVVRYSELG